MSLSPHHRQAVAAPRGTYDLRFLPRPSIGGLWGTCDVRLLPCPSIHLPSLQEGCRSTEGYDLRVRVLQQLANIAMDAAQDAMDAAAAPSAGHISGGCGGGHTTIFSSGRSTSSASPAVLGVATASLSTSPPVFLPEKHRRFVQLVNLALHDTLKVWMGENIKVRRQGGGI